MTPLHTLALASAIAAGSLAFLAIGAGFGLLLIFNFGG